MPKHIWEINPEEFEGIEKLDSKVFIEIPQEKIIEPFKYRRWLINLEIEWMTKFNNNEHYHPVSLWNDNEEDGIKGYFGDVLISHSKLFRYDGTMRPVGPGDFRAKRGYLIRDHYSEQDVIKVQVISRNLINFLNKKNIIHKKLDFQRR